MSLGLFQAIAKLLPNPVLLCTADGQILAANPAATRFVIHLRAGADLFGLAAEDSDLLRLHMNHWLRSGDPLPGSLTVKDPGGQLVRFRCHGARAIWWDGPQPAVQLHMTRLDHTDQFVALSQQVIALNREVAYRRAAEAERERLLAAEKSGRARLQHLYQLTAALASAATLAQVAQAVHQTAPGALNATGVDLQLHSRRLIPSLEPDDTLFALAGNTWTDLDRRSPRTPDRANSVGVAGDHGATTAHALLQADGVELGGLLVHHRPDDGPAPEHLTAVAQQIAQAVRRAGLYEHEHRVAERLQLSLLPRLPPVTGLDLAGCYAAGTNQVKVGGDWYDVHLLDEEHIGLTIGDVAGHGLAEAAAMAQISAALRSIAMRCGHRPADVLHELNDFVGRYHPDLMATACYLVLNRRTHTLRYARAGHPPPLLITVDGKSRYLDQALAPPVGPVPEARYCEAEVAMECGDTVLLYTDGLIERRGESLDVGLDRLTALAEATVGLSAAHLCDLFLNHQPGAEFPDDRALLAVSVPAATLPAPRQAERPQRTAPSAPAPRSVSKAPTALAPASRVHRRAPATSLALAGLSGPGRTGRPTALATVEPQVSPAHPGLTNPPRGDHACCVYSDDQQWSEAVTAFVGAGLAKGERVLYFTDGTQARTVVDALGTAGLDVDAALASGQLAVQGASQSYLQQLPFDPDMVIAGMQRACEDALAAGYPGLRIGGEMDWCTRSVPGAERLLEYELRLESEVFAELPLTGLCLFDRRVDIAGTAALPIAAHRTHVVPGHLGEDSRVLKPIASLPVSPPLHVRPLREGAGAQLVGHADPDSRAYLTAALGALVRLPAAVVHLDLSGTDFLDVEALAQLVHTAGALRSEGRRLVLHRPPLSLLRAAQMFPDECSVLEMAA
ncbi:SpoIIE family protein phosphatase [Kitasatospora sp. NBC_01302]|uniref:SpoIIE family protein phosphatase n=1 Tax=Kitasatospora sp. NBC_01302 TaxID=2903575 RepID=UPI002E124A3C|nr:SpoIIE family protein phosphatase [Kitasatospora sp. NBC_01302]